METDQILGQIFRKQPSLRQMIREALLTRSQIERNAVRHRHEDIVYCVLSLQRHHQFSTKDAIAGTISAIAFDDPDFRLDFDAIAAIAPKRYLANPLPS